MVFTDPPDVAHQESPPPISGSFRGSSGTSQIRQEIFRGPHHLHSLQISIPFYHTRLQEVILREIEKDIIRQEIIAPETARRRRLLLEAEVRRELMMESANGVDHSISFVRPAAHSAGVMAEDVTVEEKIVMGLNGGKQRDTLSFQGGTEDSRGAKTVSYEETKVISLDQPPEEKISGSKRKAETPPPPRANISNEVPLGNMILNTKKPKEDWSCEICRVRANTKMELENHFRGKKHRAKEAAEAGKITTAVDARAKKKRTLSPPRADISNEVPLGNMILNTKKPNEVWSCEICRVIPNTKMDLDKHFRGKKHKAKEAAEAGKITTAVDACAKKNDEPKSENGELVDKAGVEHEKICDEIKSEVKKISTEGSALEIMTSEFMNEGKVVEAENERR